MDDITASIEETKQQIAERVGCRAGSCLKICVCRRVAYAAEASQTPQQVLRPLWHCNSGVSPTLRWAQSYVPRTWHFEISRLAGPPVSRFHCRRTMDTDRLATMVGLLATSLPAILPRAYRVPRSVSCPRSSCCFFTHMAVDSCLPHFCFDTQVRRPTV